MHSWQARTVARYSSLTALICSADTGTAISATTSSITSVSYDHRALKINGIRRVLISGSVHYPRSTPEMWPDIIAKAKAGGLDIIETYVFWNMHEPVRRQYNFEGRFDLVRFLKAVQEAGLFAHLRIGPYACAEWNYGGFPVWLHRIPGLKIMRTDNEPFKNEMQNFTTKIVNMMKEQNLFAWQGGPIILAQIENEYGNVQSSYGEKGKSYIQWAAKMAESLNIGVPWVMCQQGDAPSPMINTCNGFYCDNFEPNSTHKSPKMWTENWTGWFQTFGGRSPHRTSEDVAYSVARFFQRGGTFQNYYMYHGGTNFGRTAGGPFIITSYDYDAPIDEYGNIRQPKWGHLKQLHSALKLSERALTHGLRKTVPLGHHLQATVYFEKSSSVCAAFLSNTDSKRDANVIFNKKSYNLPAWSVSILPDCKNVVYNTAKVTVQTSLVGMKSVNIESLVNKSLSTQGEPYVNWTWYTEPIGAWGNDNFSNKGLLEQIDTTGDKSDYLWYTTSLHVHEDEPFLKNNSQPALNVKSRGHALHVFVNGQFAGTTTGSYEKPSFTLKMPITLRAGENHIALLNMTVGLQNYGPFFDTRKAGITSVRLLSFKNGPKKLSSHNWVYQTGLKGEFLQIYSDTGAMNVEWNFGLNPPEHGALTWYKIEFNAPDGDNPVALDLSSMTKGQAWINGMNIGRYWASYSAPKDGCSACDYRGPYSPTKCTSNCGRPSQTWYHVPRSLLRPTGNSLVLLEEIGGILSGISFGTRQVDTICGHVSQADPNLKVQLKCSLGQRISSVTFASFGNPEGLCGNFREGSCNARNSSSIGNEACLGREECSLTVSEEIFGNPCDETNKILAVEAVCQY